MHPTPLISSAALTCLLALLAPITGYAQTCKPASIPATTPTSQFTDHGDGTVTDTKTKLMWKRCSEGQAWNDGTCTGKGQSLTWQQALQYAESINNNGGYAGHYDWRLPNIKELRSIVERQCYGPTINLNVFPATVMATFWSSSTRADGGEYAWNVYFASGSENMTPNHKSLSYQVRLVRDTTFSCTGAILANAAPWDAEDSTDLIVDTLWSYSARDTDAKCQFNCSGDYRYSSSTNSCYVLIPQ